MPKVGGKSRNLKTWFQPFLEERQTNQRFVGETKKCNSVPNSSDGHRFKFQALDSKFKFMGVDGKI